MFLRCFRHRHSRIQAKYYALFGVCFTVLSLQLLLELVPPVAEDAGTNIGSNEDRIRISTFRTQPMLSKATVSDISAGRKPSMQQRLTESNKLQNTREHGGTVSTADIINESSTGGDGRYDHARHTPPKTYIFNCSNIHKLVLTRKIGQGRTKQVFIAKHERQKVAVKMVTRDVLHVTSCKRNPFTEKELCGKFPSMKLMKEILILQQLSHPNLLRMLGYCVRSEETDSMALKVHGVVTIHEYGLPFHLSTVHTWPFHMRISTAYDLADLLEYFQKSPLGSLRIPDLKDEHFLLCEGRIKLIDVDDVTSADPNCLGKVRRKCPYGVSCVDGICTGHNAWFNIDRMNRVMFKELLSAETVNPTMNGHIQHVRQMLDNVAIKATQLKAVLKKYLLK